MLFRLAWPLILFMSIIRVSSCISDRYSMPDLRFDFHSASIEDTTGSVKSRASLDTLSINSDATWNDERLADFLCSSISPTTDRLEWRHLSGGRVVLRLPSCFWSVAEQFTSILIASDGRVILRGSDNIGQSDPLLALSSNLTDLSLSGVLLQDSLSGNGIDGDGSFTANISAFLDARRSTLETFSVNYGGIRGSLPSDLSPYTKLRSLALGSNQLTGPLPISYPAAMSAFIVFQNNCSGSLPPSLPANMADFDARLNDLSGSIPVTFLTELNRRTINIRLSHNALSGPLPAPLLSPIWIRGTLYLDLAFNQISGTIPANLLENFDYEEFALYLNDNELEGSMPAGLLSNYYFSNSTTIA